MLLTRELKPFRDVQFYPIRAHLLRSVTFFFWSVLLLALWAIVLTLIGFNGAEINCGIAKIWGILQMNSYLSYGLQILRFFKTTTSLLSSLCRVNNYYKSICGLQLFNPGGGVLPYMGCIGMCNELALVKVKGSRRPAAHPHPENPKVPPRVFNRGLKQGRRRRQWKGR